MNVSSSTKPGRFSDGSGTLDAKRQWEHFRNQSKAIHTGFPKIDRVWKPASGQYVLLAGRPGAFKTGFAWNLGCNLASRGSPVLWVNMEPSMATMFELYVARKARIPRDLLGPHSPGLTLEQNASFNAAAEEFQNMPFVFHFEDPNVQAVIERAKRVPFSAVIIDYVQLLDSLGASSRTDRVTKVSNALRDFAHQTNTFTLGLVQMNRNIETDGEKERLPQLSDLKDSSALEADADIVAFMYDIRPRGDFSSVTLYTCKNRFGPAGSFVRLSGNGPLCEVLEVDTEEGP